MISVPCTHPLPLTVLTVSPEDNTFSTLPPAEETSSLKRQFDHPVFAAAGNRLACCAARGRQVIHATLDDQLTVLRRILQV